MVSNGSWLWSSIVPEPEKVGRETGVGGREPGASPAVPLVGHKADDDAGAALLD